MQSKSAFGNTLKRPSRRRSVLSVWGILPCLALLGSLGLATKATADTSLLTASALSLYDDPQDGGAPADANAGPVRLARFAYLTGDVTWRSSADSSWSAAARNMPLRQGAQIWVADAGRAEIQFDDGSRLRLDSNTLVTLQTLYSDAQGEFTEITLNDGQVYLRLNNKFSLYQVNTPQASLKATGPAHLRVGGGEGAQFAVRRGAATIEGPGGKVTLNAGDYLDVVDGNAPYNVLALPAADGWDTWNARRDQLLDDPARNGSRYLPPNIALVANDLDQYGSWHNDPQYGWVWAPANVDPDWRPYRAGHWTWVEPFGWTWVSTENWGWAPYHYGTWVHQPYGWGWCPGPSTQYWSPGVVSFTENAGVVAWCPLAPAEVHYPTRLALGFQSGNWSLFFSIGGAAVYYPSTDRYCEPHPFGNTYVNRVTYVTNVSSITNVTVNRNTYLTSNHFVPANARWQGGTQVQAQSFGGRVAYQPVASQSFFAQGRTIGGPGAGGRPVAGPQSARVTAQSLTPTRSYQAPTQLPQQYMTRAVYRAPLPSNVPHIQSVPQTGQHFTTHPVAANPTQTPNTGGARTSPTLPGRPTEGTGSRPTTATGNPAKSPGSGSSGLDAYLRERAARNGNAGNAATGTGSKPTTPGSKDDATTRNRTDTTPTLPGRPRTNGDSTTSPTLPGRPRTNGDSTTSPNLPGRPRTNGESTTPPKTDTTPGAGKTTPPKSTAESYRPLHGSKPPVDPGKSKTPPDPKSKDNKDNSKDNSKDHKNP